MSKQYRLKKDLPDSKAGDIYEWVECIGAKNGGVYYLYGDVRLSYWQKGNVENNPEWFELVKDKIYTEDDLRAAFNASRIPTRAPYSVTHKFESFEEYMKKIDNQSVPANDPVGSVPVKYTESDLTFELEKCWNAARMKDPFSRAISQPFKYATFKDYLDKKPAKNENR